MPDPLAHPLVTGGPLVPPLVGALVAVGIVALTGVRASRVRASRVRTSRVRASRVRTSRVRTGRVETRAAGSAPVPADPLARQLAGGPVRTIGEVVATVVLLLVLVAGFAGSADPLRNISVALVVGLAWPLLLAASLVGLDVWRGANPWALPARLLAPLGAADVDSRATRPSVLPAVLPAAGLVAYLHVLPGSLEPRSVATALAVYSVWVLGGCLALGPRDWMRRGDVLGILFGWVASARRLAAWQPPHGAGVLAAVLAGGMLVTPLRRRLLVLPATDRPALREAAVALVLVAAVYTAVVVARRWPGASPALVVALVPGAAAVAVADSLQFTRVATSAQVVVRAVSDPLGRGWDLFGTAGRSLQPWFIDDPVRALAQALVTVGGFALGAVAIGRRHATGALDTRGRDVALGLLCALLAVAVAAFLST